MSRSPSPTTAERAAGLALAALLAASAASAGHPWRFPHAEGAAVRFEGSVSDAAGNPVAGVEVALEASTPRFDWRRFSPAQRTERRTTRTDERGRFALDWVWDGAYRRFELAATLREQVGGRELARELARLEVSDRVATATPVVAALVIDDAAGLARLRAFLTGLDSDDELRVWREAGLPESIDRVVSPDSEEAAWWYFSAGRVVRFRDGVQTAVDTFPPVRPIGDEAAP